MKKLFALLIFVLIFSFCMIASAQTSIPSGVYITQAEDLTCTLAATTMMFRARAYLSGYARWSDITESSVKEVAWGSGGLLWDIRYEFSGNSISASHAYVGAMSVDDVKRLLDLHPEGVMLYSYAGNQNWYGSHAVLATDYEGDTIYCADPASGYSLKRIPIADSRIGAWYSGQSNVLSHINYYWYVSSFSIGPADTQNPVISNAKVSDISTSGYTVTCIVSDNVGIQNVRFPTWTDPNEQDDIINPWPSGSISNGVATYRVNVSDHNNERNCLYITHIYAYDYAGNYVCVPVAAFVPANHGGYLPMVSDRVIPNGDYIIANTGCGNKSNLLYLDIPGTTQSWRYDDANVVVTQAAQGQVSAYDVWSVSYNESKKYYIIKQKGTNMALTVDFQYPTVEGANVLVHDYQEADSQYWRILESAGNGYLIQSYGSSYALDVAGGGDVSGTNVQQWGVNSGAAQSWMFIPYNPSYPIGLGRYVILDHSGNFSLNADQLNGDNIRVSDFSVPSNENMYELSFASDGYYKFKHVATGKCLEVANGSSLDGANVRLWEDNGSIAQQ